MENRSLNVAITSITAALYIALGYIFQPISFLGLQFRVAELMVGMVILFPMPGTIGKVIGVFFVNLTSPLGAIDLLSCLANVPALGCIYLGKFYDEKYEFKFCKYLGGAGYSVIISLYVAIVLNFAFGLPFELMFVQVFIAEIVLAELGIFVFIIVGKRLDENSYFK